MKPLEINIKNFKKIDLKEEYKISKQDPIFDKIVSKLKISDDVLCNYTSLIENSVCEYRNCMECSALASCKNRIKGHVYIPVNIDGDIQFQYKSCKYYDKMQKNNHFLNNL